jgi:preprotein translocase subunit Sec61beta
VEDPFEQIAVVPEIVPAEGAAVTVTVAVVETFAHPPVPVIVYVITEVPAATPVTAPVLEPIVATAGVAEDQVPPVTVELSVEDPFEQIAVVPEIVPAEGAAVTLTVTFVNTFGQPPVPFTVYVITAVPADKLVTVPLEGLIVATIGFEEDQVPPVTVEPSVEEPFEQIEVVPEIVPADGGAVTVTVAEVETFAQPPVPVIV